MSHSTDSTAIVLLHDKICVVCSTQLRTRDCIASDPVTISTWNLLSKDEKLSIIPNHCLKASNKLYSSGITSYEKHFICDLQLPQDSTLLHTNGGFLVTVSKDTRTLRKLTSPITKMNNHAYLLCSTCYSTPAPSPVSPTDSKPYEPSGLGLIQLFISRSPSDHELEIAINALTNVRKSRASDPELALISSPTRNPPPESSSSEDEGVFD
jgi:hypothetical protein